MFARGVPSICYGLRGLVYFQIDVRAATPTCTPVSSAARSLIRPWCSAQMLTQCKDKSGNIKITGFLDDVVPLTEERKRGRRCPSTKQYRKDFGIPKVHGESGTTLERTWAPALEVNGCFGFTGQGAKTVLPAVAMAKVSMRLVPNRDPEKIATIFEDYLSKIAPKTVEVRSRACTAASRGWRRSTTSSFRRLVVRLNKALAARRCSRARWLDSGRGDLPGSARPALGALRCGLPDENAHAPNEKLDCGNFHNGIISPPPFSRRNREAQPLDTTSLTTTRRAVASSCASSGLN